MDTCFSTTKRGQIGNKQWLFNNEILHGNYFHPQGFLINTNKL